MKYWGENFKSVKHLLVKRAKQREFPLFLGDSTTKVQETV